MQHHIAEGGIAAFQDAYPTDEYSPADIQMYAEYLLHRDKSLPGAPPAFMYEDWTGPKKRVGCIDCELFINALQGLFLQPLIIYTLAFHFGPLADFIDVENLSEEIPVGAMIMCMQVVSGSLAGTRYSTQFYLG